VLSTPEAQDLNDDIHKTSDDDEEVKPVPVGFEIGPPVDEYFKDCFCQEDQSEHYVCEVFK
jgi:hypothetical protein